VTSFLWALGLALYLWLFMLAVGVDGATATILAGLAFFAIFLFVRLLGEDELRPYRAPRPRRGAGSQAGSSRERPR
jgi:amino acid permease